MRSTLARRVPRLSALPLIAGGVASLAPPADAAESPDVHVVEPGDTLSDLAVRHDTTTAELVSLNGLLHADAIRIGQTLRLPTARPTSAAPTGITASSESSSSYQVRAGETLSEIAARLGVNADALARQNGITDPNLVWSGQVLDLRGAVAAPTTAPAPAPPAAAPGTGAVTHTIAAGESLSDVADRYGVSVDRLAVANAIADPNQVIAGQKLVIPALLPAELFGRRAGSQELAALVPVFERWASANDIAPELLMAVTFNESGWHNSVESSVGAIGIGQLMPDTAAFVSEHLIGVPLDPHDPEDNIRMSARYLGYLMGLTGGDTRQALAGYYQGLTSVRSRGWYQDTEQYVATVEALVPWFR